MPDSPLLLTFGVSLAIQAVFFAFAAGLKTDKVTDLSYGLTFVVIALTLFLAEGHRAVPEAVVTLMVVLWGLRLAGYLVYRIVRMGRDPRFDGIRERFWPFAKFWLLQGVAAWVILLPVTVWFGRPGTWNGFMTAGVLVWLAGLGIEATADAQKFRWKSSPAGAARWTDTGLWRYSRHPNYFGEILCWWGIFLFVSGDLAGWSWLAISGPLAITALLLFVTGIPPLEASAQRKWGGDPGYAEYRRRTRLLVPLPRAGTRGQRPPVRA